MQPVCKGVQNSKMDPAAISAGSERLYSSDTDFKKCLICQLCKNDPLYKLTAAGLDNFKTALYERKDYVYDRLYNLIQNKDRLLSHEPMCHKVCKSIYTHKRSGQIVECKRSKMAASNVKVPDFKTCCFICGKDRDVKGTKDMCTVSTKSRTDAIHRRASELQDAYVLDIITNENYDQINLAASKYRYHRVCMDGFMKMKGSDIKDTSTSYNQAFIQIVSEINDNLLRNGVVFSLSKLTAQYRQLLRQLNVPSSMSYRTHHMRKRLSTHFGDEIQFLNPKGITTLVCASNITLEHLCSEVLNLRQELDDSAMLTDSENSDNNNNDTSNSNRHLYLSAKCLRRQIKDKARQQRESTKTSKNIDDDIEGSDRNISSIDISSECALNIIPLDLFNYLGWLLSDDDLTFQTDGKLNVSDSLHTTIISLAQDIMFNASYIATPKHVGLGLHLIKEFRSKALLSVMNRFGNSISYQCAQRYLTTIADDLDKQSDIDGVFIPSELKNGGFIQCALDNLDFSEHTADGSTLHATTHTMYKYLRKETGHQLIFKVAIPLKKGRGIALQSSPLFTASERSISVNDRRKARSIKGVSLLAKDSETHSSTYETENFAWHLLRVIPTNLLEIEHDDITEDYDMPSWNKFFDNLYESSEKNVIAYGPIFPDSPSKPNVVEKSLDYFMTVMSKLGQNKTVVTCDQAIYDIAKGLAKKVF